MANLQNPLMFPLAAMNYIGSMHALKQWSEGLHSLKLGSPAQVKNLEKAVEDEARARFYRWMEGVERYAKMPPKSRPELAGKVVWRCGNSSLLNYGKGEQPILVIPSLINRAYILDIAPRHSMMRHLAKHAGNAHLLDWGEPKNKSVQLDIAGYIAERLEPAIDFLYQRYGKPVHLVGYCMGGLFAIAAAQRHPQKIGKLALLATPWNFHAEGMQVPAAAPFLTQMPEDAVLPHALIHHWFYLQRPWVVHDKYARFSEYEKDSKQEAEFLRIEQWLQDGVGMSARAAKTCFVDWASNNATYHDNWKIAGQAITPNAINKPVFLGIPERDGIVTPAATAPLIHAWPHAHIHRINAGHISMIAGKSARQTLWAPLAEWL